MTDVGDVAVAFLPFVVVVVVLAVVAWRSRRRQ
jgi:hypothetical protein